MLVKILVGVLALVTVFGAWGWYKASKYDKERIKYEADAKQWAIDRAKLLGQVAERDKQIAELDVKVAGTLAAAESGKKLSDEQQAKIDQIAKDAAAEAVVIDQPTDCWIRGDRTCAKLAGLKPPIIIDCDVYKRKVCAATR